MSRPVGRALIVGSAACRAQPLGALQRMGYSCAELDDPYAAIAELAKRPMVYRALIISIASIYREELHIIGAVKRRFPHVEIWLTHTDGRQAALADAMRMGADGLLADDGLHRVAAGSPDETVAPALRAVPAAPVPSRELPSPTPVEPDPDSTIGEPVLTADELRALLSDQPSLPPSGDE